MALKTTEFDAAKFLSRPEAQDEFLADAIKSKNAGYIASARGVIARARACLRSREKAGLAREALSKSLSALGITIAMHVSRDHKKKNTGCFLEIAKSTILFPTTRKTNRSTTVSDQILTMTSNSATHNGCQMPNRPFDSRYASAILSIT